MGAAHSVSAKLGLHKAWAHVHTHRQDLPSRTQKLDQWLQPMQQHQCCTMLLSLQQLMSKALCNAVQRHCDMSKAAAHLVVAMILACPVHPLTAPKT